MCGIAVIMNITGTVILQAPHVNVMVSRMVHREPDDEGYLLIRNSGMCLTHLGKNKHIGDPESLPVQGHPSERAYPINI